MTVAKQLSGLWRKKYRCKTPPVEERDGRNMTCLGIVSMQNATCRSGAIFKKHHFPFAGSCLLNLPQSGAWFLDGVIEDGCDLSAGDSG